MNKKIVLIDGNSILNRAFYGIMGSKMLTTSNGKYTNAIYGFLAILFKVLDDLTPEYLMVAFDLKAPTARHKMYERYKANRKGMPNELAEQMPILKDILRAMNITIIEKEGYEADDILGTLAKRAEKEGLDVTIVSGDRDTFQLTSPNIKVRIPHTKAGKTEVDVFDEQAIIEKYGITPKQLIEVKGLQGDTSDNIPGVPGIGEKTALELIKQYHSISELYKAIEKDEADIKQKAKEKLLANKELAELSRTLGTINLEVPIEETIEDLKRKEWNEEEVYNKFKELDFNRFIERFGLHGEEENPKDIHELFKIKTISLEGLKSNDKIEDINKNAKEDININENEDVQTIQDILNKIKQDQKIVYFLQKEKIQQEEFESENYEEENQKNTNKNNQNQENVTIIPKQIKTIYILQQDEYNKDIVYEIKIDTDYTNFIVFFKSILEDSKIQKCSYQLNENTVLFKQIGIDLDGLYFDAEIAGYVLNPTNNHYSIEELSNQYLNLNIASYLEVAGIKQEEQKQMTLFVQEQDESIDCEKYRNAMYVYTIAKLQEIMMKKMEEYNCTELFQNIEMPLVKVLANMQYNGIYVDKEELISFGNKLKEEIETLKQDIYTLCGEVFNINSTQQLGVMLFEKLKLPVYKKTKRGYSTDVDILEKLRSEHPVIEKILEYRSLMKLNSTYVEGLLPYINERTNKIHSYFHQTITATGRISSTEPNLQNIPTRIELGKQIRKAFKPGKGNIFIDADYSQIELRVLAHISKDENMMQSFMHEEDIHRQVASKVFNVPLEEVTKEQRTAAKAVNFGIVYGISGFGLAEQLGISRKKADNYINQYLEKYEGVKNFMNGIVEEAKEKGYVETIYHRRRYITELSSNNYMVRQFGTRAAMNTPIQGTAADIMKIAMIKVFNKLREERLEAKLILQIHDELLIECKIEQKDKVKQILKDCMEQAVSLNIPLKVEVSEAYNWYEVK